MSGISRKIQRLRKLLQEKQGKPLYVTLIYADGSERKMEVNEAFFALDRTVVDYRWEESNHLADDNFLGALLFDGPFDVRDLFVDGDDSEILPEPK